MSLFERRVESAPGNIAIRYQDHNISYGELKAQSDRIACYLQQRLGVEPGDLVGVMLERGEYLVPSIFGVLKAGCAYVPIDPQFPAERINTILADSWIGVLLTSSRYRNASVVSAGVTVDLDEIWDALQAGSPDEPDKVVNSESLAYVIYTSGSTGKPKGVMISHHSVVNRLLWMQQRYQLDASDVLVQKTPVVFDVSVWELFWWSITGASLCMLKPGGEKDPEELIRAIAQHQVSTIHFVPSMLRQFLPAVSDKGVYGELKSLRYVFSSGEALATDLAMDFGSTLHKGCGTRLINLYGPTEATVDVSYYECDFNESGISIPIGRPIDNHRLYVLDGSGHLQPVGVAGELYISGVGLAQGYVNNPVLTSERFVKDPYTAGGLMYRTGDLARWRPDGTIEYLGRLDDQVKVRGFRIELGEIESRLKEHEQIDAVAAGVKERGGEKYLVACYVSSAPVDAAELRRFLSASLPDYMIPSYFIAIDHLPLTSNGKLDRKRLPDPELKPAQQWQAPATKEEKVLAAVWSKVLGVKDIDVNANFFSIGGDSILSIRISARMRAEGYEVSVEDIYAHPTIHLLSTRLKESVTVADQSPVTGIAPLTPIQRFFFEITGKDKHHFNQSVMLRFDEVLTESSVRLVFKALQEHHDALRLVFREDNGVVMQESKGIDLPVSLEVYDLRKFEKEAAAQLSGISNQVQSAIDLENGPLMKLALFHMQDGSRLLIVIHHLAVDGISWRILFEDIETLYRQVKNNDPLSLPLKTDSYLSWAKGIWNYTASQHFQAARNYWEQLAQITCLPLVRDYPDGTNTIKESAVASFYLDKEQTQQLVTDVQGALDVQINDILLTALLLSAGEQWGRDTIKIDMEGHGREDIQQGLNVSRTVGCFTSIFPVVLKSKGNNLEAVLLHVKETLRAIPGNGIDSLLVKYAPANIRSATDGNANRSQICFNYLGQFDSDTDSEAYTLAEESRGEELALSIERPYDWDISGMIINGQLKMDLRYSTHQYSEHTIIGWMNAYRDNLVKIIQWVNSRTDRSGDVYYEITPNMRYWVDESMEREYKQAEKTAGPLLLMYKVSGDFDPETFRKAVALIVKRHESLRATFHTVENKYMMRVEDVTTAYDMEYIDLRKQPEADRPAVEHTMKQDGKRLQLNKGPLFFSQVIQVDDREYVISLKLHHAISDRWSNEILLRELLIAYKGIIVNKAPRLHELHYQFKDLLRSFNKYIRENCNAHKEYWRNLFPQLPGALEIPGACQPLNRVPSDRVRKRINVSFPDMLKRRLHTIAVGNGTTLFVVLQTTFKAFLFYKTGQHDILIGTFTSGRDYPETYDQIGCYARTDLIRTVFDNEDSFEVAVRKVRKANDDMANYRAYTLMNAMSELMGEHSRYNDFWKLILLYTGKTAFDINDAAELTEGLQIEQLPFVEQDNALMPIDMILDFRELEDQLILDVQFDGSTYKEELVSALFNEYLQYAQAATKNCHASLRGEKALV